MSAYFRLKSPQIPVPLLTPARISAILNIVCLKTDITNIFLVNEGLFLMEKRKKFIINFLYFAIIIAAVFLALQFALTLLFPFVAALFIAYILKHPIRFVSKKTRLPRRLVAVLMVLIFYGTIGTFLVLASIRAFSFVSDLVQQLPQIFRIFTIRRPVSWRKHRRLQRLRKNTGSPQLYIPTAMEKAGSGTA